MIAPAAHLRTDDQIAGYFAQAVEAVGPDVPWALQDYPLTLTVQMSVPVISRIMTDHPSCVMLKARGLAGAGEDLGAAEGCRRRAGCGRSRS